MNSAKFNKFCRGVKSDGQESWAEARNPKNKPLTAQENANQPLVSIEYDLKAPRGLIRGAFVWIITFCVSSAYDNMTVLPRRHFDETHVHAPPPVGEENIFFQSFCADHRGGHSSVARRREIKAVDKGCRGYAVDQYRQHVY